MFKTRITELFGIEYPIICGGMAPVSTPELVAAVSNAGGLGVLVSAPLSSVKELRNQIRKTKSLTDKPFGVNINMLPALRQMDNNEIIDVVIEEGVRVAETVGQQGVDEYIARLKEGNVKVYHKSTMVRHARRAERVGVDAVGMVGYEGGSAVGMEDVSVFVLVPQAVDALSIPVLAVGGTADAHGFVAALALGAEGVVMGTRFMAAKESKAHPKVKEWMLQASETDTLVIHKTIRTTHRMARTPIAERVLGMEMRGASLEELAPIIKGEQTRKLIEEGDMNLSPVTCGQVVGRIHEILSAKEIIDNIVNGAKEIRQRLDAVLTVPA